MDLTHAPPHLFSPPPFGHQSIDKSERPADVAGRYAEFQRILRAHKREVEATLGELATTESEWIERMRGEEVAVQTRLAELSTSLDAITAAYVAKIGRIRERNKVGLLVSVEEWLVVSSLDLV